MSVRCGYACISQVLRKDDIFTSRTLRMQTFREKGIEYVRSLVTANVADLAKLIEYNEQHGYRFFRISSEIFPHISNEELGEMIDNYTIDFTHKQLAEIGAAVRKYGHRITAHPSQYVQLGTPRDEVLRRSIRDLRHHAEIFNAMGLEPRHGTVMILHGGGSYGDKAATLARWEKSYSELPEDIRKYIVLENDETQYSVMDLLPMCERNRIPICIDFFHHECMFGSYDDLIKNEDLLTRVHNIWASRGIKQKIHYSSQRDGARLGTHDDYIKSGALKDILKFCAKWSSDIMCECKQKDLCLQRVLDEYFVKQYSGESFYWKLNI
jgi:UV DNA damage endonuclease